MSIYKKCIIFFLFVLLLTNFSFSKLIIGGDNNFPPYEFINEIGEPDGFNIDILKAIFRVQGLNYEINLDTWAIVRSALEKEEIDMISGMFFSESRAEFFEFSNPFIKLTHTVFHLKSIKINSIEDLLNRTVIVQKGDIMHDFAIENNLDYHLITLSKPEEALRKLASEKYKDAVVLMGKYQGLYLIEKYGLNNIVSADFDLKISEYCFSTHKGNNDLIFYLNEGLDIIIATNEYNEIRERWFGSYESDLSDYLSLILIIIIPIFSVFLFILLWNMSLKKSVRNKTKELNKSKEELENAYIELNTKTNRINTIINTIPDLLFVYDKNGNYKEIYTKDESLLVTKKEKMLDGMSINDVLNDKVSKKFMKAINESFETNQMISFDYHLNLNDRKMFFEARVVAINDQEIIALCRDITEKKLVEIELKKAKFEAEKSNEAKTNFLSIVSHELRTPMNGILGGCELAKRRNNLNEIREYLNVIEISANRLMPIINDVLDISRIEKNIIEFNNVKFSVNKLINEVINFMKLKAEEKNISILFDNQIKNDLLVIGDETKISQILNNIIYNSIKFTDKGKIEIFSKSEMKNNEKILLKFTVKDTGIGISENFQKYIFNPFEQEEKYITRKHGGTGLGLTIAKELIEKMNGEITVSSKLGKGTTFKFFIELKTSH